jgi:translation initiation factor 4E
VLWFDNLLRQREGGGSWFENLAQVAIFNTVEDFWAVMNHIRSAHDLENGANYHFFKEGVKPMWEDEANKGGGKWQLTIYDEAHKVEALWEALLLAMIGEMLGSDDVVDCVRGAVFAKRKTVKAQKKGPRISLWLGKNTKEGYIAIGQRLREALQLPATVELEFTEHEGAEALGHSSGAESTLVC